MFLKSSRHTNNSYDKWSRALIIHTNNSLSFSFYSPSYHNLCSLYSDQHISMASSSYSASDSQYCPRWKYDVFLSFRGIDTRKIFTGHLYEGLKNRGIFTFQDDKRLEKGDSIPEELLKAIEESQVALVIFSKNYAESRWCLDELVKIMECKEEKGQRVIPVFYDVYASEVRHQTESFAEAFAKHESKYINDVEGMKKVKGWRTALSDAADLKGCNIHDRIESECIQELVDNVSSKLCKTSLSYCQDIVGIDTHLEKVKSLLAMEMNDVRIIGIWGIGGVGKTTIAKAIFDTQSYQFKAACFLADVKENARKNQLHSLQEFPDERYKKFSLEVVNHAKGLPLALKVWGSLLHTKGLTQWRRTVDQIKKNLNSEIVEKLRISYDGLEHEEQEIFLDIACFFRGYRRTEVMQILESCDFGAEYGLDVLIDKSLVFISEYDKIEMHDLIEDMGKYIVKMQKHPGERSRLWDAEDIKKLMLDNTGTMAVEAIWFSYYEKICFSKEAMKNMQRLRILCIRYLDYYLLPFQSDIPIEYLPNNLCWFVWYHYPWKLLPEKFNPIRLVHLDLQYSSLHHLWNETKQQLPSLRKLNLNGSKRLKRTPDFTEMPNLEYLDLKGCTSLEEIHHSLRCSRKLIKLSLSFCESLERFPYVNVESLESLNLYCCSSLEKFPEFLGIMKPELKIRMSNSRFRELPLSIIHLQADRTELDLRGMNNLVSLPSSIYKLKGLVKLDVSWCSKLERLPEEIGDLEKLEELDASYTQISRPPSSIVRLNKLKFLSFAKQENRVYFVFPRVNEGLLSLEELDLRYCNLIDGGLPEDIGSLSSLKKLYLQGNNFEHLPRSIAQLSGLQSLYLSNCKRLKELLGFMGMPNLETLYVSYCNLIDGGLPEDIGCLSSLKELNLSGNNFEHLPRSIAQLGALQSLYLSNCKRLTQLPQFPQQLNTINAHWSNDWICNSLFQNISSLQHDNSASDSLSLRVFTSFTRYIPSWFHHQEMDTSHVSVNLPENWDNLLGFAVCYSGRRIIDMITAHLIPLCDDGMSSMTRKLALSNHSEHPDEYAIYFFLVPIAVLWDASNANGKTPNDYGRIRLYSSGDQMDEFGVRLLYKDEAEICIGIKRNRYEEASCSSSKKQISQVQVPVSSKT